MQNPQNEDENQGPDFFEVQIRLRRLNLERRTQLTQELIARRLGTTQTEVSRALSGTRPELLARIDRYLVRLEIEQERRMRKRAKKKEPERVRGEGNNGVYEATRFFLGCPPGPRILYPESVFADS